MIALYPIHVITRCIMKPLHSTMYVVYIPKSGTEMIRPDCADAQADLCLCNLHTILQRNYRKVTILWSFSCNSFVKFILWSFSCYSFVKFILWSFSCYSFVKFILWSFSCNSFVKFILWSFSYNSFVKFHSQKIWEPQNDRVISKFRF